MVLATAGMELSSLRRDPKSCVANGVAGYRSPRPGELARQATALPIETKGGPREPSAQGLDETSSFIFLWRSSNSHSISATRRYVRAACI